MRPKVIVAHKDPLIMKEVGQILASQYDVETAISPQKLADLVRTKQFSSVFMGNEWPGANSAFDICEQIVNTGPEIPVFFVDRGPKIADRIMAYTSGADDYLHWPMEKLEFRAKVDARVRKFERVKDAQDILSCGPIKIDKISGEVSSTHRGEKEIADLTSLELKLFSQLLQNAGKIVERDKLLDTVWGQDVHVYSRCVDTHISKIRKKIDTWPCEIKSIHGRGYKFKVFDVALEKVRAL